MTTDTPHMPTRARTAHDGYNEPGKAGQGLRMGQGGPSGSRYPQGGPRRVIHSAPNEIYGPDE